MVIGLLQMNLRIPYSQSLKAKRHALLGLKTRLRQRFNVSVSEVDHQDKWQLATLAVACVGSDQPDVNQSLSYVVEMTQREREIELTDHHMEFL